MTSELIDQSMKLYSLVLFIVQNTI